MPRRAIRLDGSLVVSCPSNRMDPSRRGTIAMIDRSVVVLPAPLRPRSVTTSPAATSNVTPCRTCDSPYQALRSRTERSVPLPDAGACPDVAFSLTSGMGRSHVSLHDVGMLRDVRVVTLGEHLPARKHGD